MAHSHDRTLVQALGADLDHKLPLHDAACLYLQERARVLAEKFCISTKKVESQVAAEQKDFSKYVDLSSLELCRSCWFEFEGGNYHNGYRTKSYILIPYKYEDAGISSVKTTLEWPVVKGDGKYQSHIGFIDLVISAVSTVRNEYLPQTIVFNRRCGSRAGEHNADKVKLLDYPGKVFKSQGGESRYLNIEVKIKPCPIGDLIRQIKLYQQYAKFPSGTKVTWLVATAYPLEAREVRCLANEGIQAIRLAEDYAERSGTPGMVEVF